MKLTGKLEKGSILLREVWMDEQEADTLFHDRLERQLVRLCREIEIPVPIWLKKNTREIARYRKTFFGKEQFMEDVFFDRFILEIRA